MCVRACLRIGGWGGDGGVNGNSFGDRFKSRPCLLLNSFSLRLEVWEVRKDDANRTKTGTWNGVPLLHLQSDMYVEKAHHLPCWLGFESDSILPVTRHEYYFCILHC